MYKRYLSLDVGDVRIGVAKSDIMGMIATPLEVIDRRKTKAVWMERKNGRPKR